MRVFALRDGNRIFRKFTLFLALGWLTLLSFVVVSIPGYADELSVELRVTPPNIQTIVPGKGPKRIHIQANTSRQQGIKFSWNLDGPGKLLQTTGPGTFYIPSDKFDGPFTEAIVAVIVTAPDGKQATASVTFTIETSMPTPGPTSLQIRIRDIVLHSETGFRIYEVENRHRQ